MGLVPEFYLLFHPVFDQSRVLDGLVGENTHEVGKFDFGRRWGVEAGPDSFLLDPEFLLSLVLPLPFEFFFGKEELGRVQGRPGPRPGGWA